ncbi:uncharacterized protein CPUR_05392 [Claviceps purpurea 20.1]|uniref:F-box domain-containing protein n=1 Tax=Claviceps purpurea (strain 20.1) TaxID=1111077 RepID=M1WG82_CLAP2|nr:uncharacterized protein CPUR_05392 [Claviceps purpurea 20.1]
MPPSPASEKPKPTMADLIESGRHSFAAKRYSQASQFFSRAMKICPCARGVEQGRPQCKCKRYERVAAREGSIYKEAMYHCVCVAGKKYSKCDNFHHFQALDFQATTSEAMGELYEAINYAEWMLELAPQLPDGYLRVGRIARLLSKYHYAWKIYTAGIEAYKETAAGSSAKLQKLYDGQKLLHRFSLKQDPFCLPAELVTDVFSYLSYQDILVCFRVCKQWERTLTSPLHGQLWRNMIFKASTSSMYPSEKSMPRLDLLRKMLLWAGDGGAREIVVPRSFGMTQPALTLLLEASPRLEHLDIYVERHYASEGLTLPSNEKICVRLRHVSIKGFFDRIPVDLPGGFPQMFLQNAASTLEHLNITSIPMDWYNSVPSIPPFPKLKTLGIHCWQDGGTPFPIYPLSIAFPRLEQLSFASLLSLSLEPVTIWQKERKNIWPHLKVLMFRSGKTRVDKAMTYSTLRYLASLNSLQHIHFNLRETCDTKQHDDIFGGNDDRLTDSGGFPQAQLQNLRSLRSEKMWISPDRARTLLSNAVKNGKFTSFDIIFPRFEINGRFTAEASVRHLKGYDWLRGNPKIHTLSCHDFYFMFDREDEEDRLLPRFLATFPNLRTLTIFAKYYLDTQLRKMVLEILKVTNLKIIHLSNYKRHVVLGLELEEVARSKGTKILWEPEPPIWPISLEQ